MTILTMNRKELEKRIGKVTPEVEERITQMGTPVEEVSSEEVSVEVFPNRPDLLSLENFSRAYNQFVGKRRVADFKVVSSKEVLKVSRSVPSQWPFAIACIVKGLKLSDDQLKQIIDLQEKLSGSILRKRRKGGIGVYPLDKISFPVRFEGRESSKVLFRPLESDKELTANQILKDHPTGMTYASICDDWKDFPVFVDSKDNILSMPPIINSHDTGRVEVGTKDLFVETTGTNLHAVLKAFHIMVSSLYEMGGKLFSVECVQRDGTKLVCPDFSPEKLEFKLEDLERTLGISLPVKQVKSLLAKMGIGYETKGNKHIALVPAYRTDMLHWIDLTEEIAIAYGYNNFEPEIPSISTIAVEDDFERKRKVVSEILVGMGLLEASSYHIASKKNIKKMHFDYKDFIELEDSKTERDVLRIDLLSNLLQILSENSDSSYPQKLFESGRVFSRDFDGKTQTGVLETDNLAIILIDDEMNFTQVKQILDYLFKMLDVEYSVETVDDSNYIPGRVGKILVQGVEVGKIGEIAPRVIKNWKIKAPIAACEFDLRKVFYPK